MSINNIGINISTLRKTNKITQEELAKTVGVSPQAVSKWENGGVPDTELLPRIADFFSVSIDKLFGRSITEYDDIKILLTQKIAETNSLERFQAAFEYCWEIERALSGEIFENDALENHLCKLKETDQLYSSMIFDEGFTRMGLANKLQYFLLVPEPSNSQSALFDGINYTELFGDLSDNDVFNAFVYLHQRENNSSFTPKLLVKHLNITEEKSLIIIDILKKYRFVHSSFIELDDATHEIYRFTPTPSFVALLIFAREIIDKPNTFSYCWQNRKVPYLK